MLGVRGGGVSTSTKRHLTSNHHYVAIGIQLILPKFYGSVDFYLRTNEHITLQCIRYGVLWPRE